MIVSWNWLKQYVLLDMPVEQLTDRLMMAGLNHESTKDVDGDFAIDLEVTSNRPDCLGHLGIAREVAAVWGREIKLPPAAPRESGPPVASLTQVRVECPDLCPRYTARVIQGVKIGPSPDWMQRRLTTLGLSAINNVVDITNYVLMECGQPLHAFDLARLRGRQIVVRNARAGEKLVAINHETYELAPGMCVIADAEQPVGLGGVMGGADSEISDTTTDLLIEAAEFKPLAIRDTARQLVRSDSSYRFERGLDPQGIDWASRRCCELILELAGGTLATGVIDIGQQPAARAPIVLRLSQLPRILGIEIDTAKVRQILKSLGLVERRASETELEVTPPSWRRDLTREIDLVEEVARVHGYHHIPEDAVVPLTASHRTKTDRVLDKVRFALTAQGYDEAITLSAVDERTNELFSPWSGEAPLRTGRPVLEQANRLRRSLVPSLLQARRLNEAQGNTDAQLFEIARAYLPRVGQLPEEPWLVGVCGSPEGESIYRGLKGALEAIVHELNPQAAIEARDFEHPLYASGAELWLGGQRLGFVGEIAPGALEQFDLRQPCGAGEVRLDVLLAHAQLAPQDVKLPAFPAAVQDLNFLVDEGVRYGELALAVRSAGGALLEGLTYRETYRSAKLPAGKKKLLVRITLRNRERTMTGDEISGCRAAIKTACRTKLGAELED